jgi:hypothetical protein
MPMQWNRSFIVHHLIPFVLLCLHIFLKPWGADEPLHLHSSYQVGMGMKPYRDFFAHLFPLTWYIGSPIALFNGFVSKIAFSKALQSLFIIASLASLSYVFPEYGRWRTWAFCLILLLFAPFGGEYLQVRPEFFAIPFAILASGILLRKPEIGTPMAVLLGFLCGSHLLLTLRVYSVVAFFGLAMLLMRYPPRIKLALLVSGILTFSVLSGFFGIRDMLFFIFEIQMQRPPIEFANLHYDSVGLRMFVAFLAFSVILQIARFKDGGWVALALNCFLAIMWIVEKRPYQATSLHFMFFHNFVFIFDTLMRWVRAAALRDAALVSLTVLTLFGTVKRNIYRNPNYFAKADLFERKIAACEGKAFFGTVASSLLYPGREERLHPIFVEDYSYFGDLWVDVLEGRMESVIEHNKGKGVRYFSERSPCYIDTKVYDFIMPYFPKVRDSLERTGVVVR